MLEPSDNTELASIPNKRYFTIGEVSGLCEVKPHVLRYWEQEFPDLRPVKRRGNRRYYQRHDVMLIRQIRSLLYNEGYTIGGARQKLSSEEAPGRRQSITADYQAIARRARRNIKDIKDIKDIKALISVCPHLNSTKLSDYCILLALFNGVWRSLVAHLHGVQVVRGSNPLIPTNFI